jgi:hypothetical protein
MGGMCPTPQVMYRRIPTSWNLPSNPCSTETPKHKKVNGVGLFEEVLAWCLSTKEQDQKSLHGHYLMYIKNWYQVMNIFQRVKDEGISQGNLHYDTKGMFANACSAHLFSDFKVSKPLSRCLVFSYEECQKSEPKPKEI